MSTTASPPPTPDILKDIDIDEYDEGMALLADFGDVPLRSPPADNASAPATTAPPPTATEQTAAVSDDSSEDVPLRSPPADNASAPATTAPPTETEQTPTSSEDQDQDFFDRLVAVLDNSPPADTSDQYGGKLIHAVLPSLTAPQPAPQAAPQATPQAAPQAAVPTSQAMLYRQYKQQQGWQSCEVDAKGKLPKDCPQQVAFEDINRKVLNPKVKPAADGGAIGAVMQTIRNPGKNGVMPNTTFHLRYAAIVAYLSENQLVPPEVYSFFMAKYADNYTDDKLDTKAMRQRYKKSLHLGPKKLATGKDYRNYPVIQYGSDGSGTCTVYELKKSGAGHKASHLKTDCGGQQVRMTPDLYQQVQTSFPSDRERYYGGMMAQLAANWRHVESKFAPDKFSGFRPVLARMKARLLDATPASSSTTSADPPASASAVPPPLTRAV